MDNLCKTMDAKVGTCTCRNFFIIIVFMIFNLICNTVDVRSTSRSLGKILEQACKQSRKRTVCMNIVVRMFVLIIARLHSNKGHVGLKSGSLGLKENLVTTL